MQNHSKTGHIFTDLRSSSTFPIPSRQCFQLFNKTIFLRDKKAIFSSRFKLLIILIIVTTINANNDNSCFIPQIFAASEMSSDTFQMGSLWSHSPSRKV